MPVPTLVTDLSTTAASNSPSGSDNVFPDLDNYLRALSAFLASIRDNSGNGWTTPYLPLTYSAGTANSVLYLNGSKVVTTGSGLTFDGTNFATTGTASATKLIPTGGSATGNGMYLPAANTLGFSTNGAEVARLDSSGNLGLGVTPSAWGSGQKAIQMQAGAIWNFNAFNMTITQNAYSDGTEKYIGNGFASKYNQNSGVHIWSTAPSGTAGNAITFTQAMTLDASGNLGVGITSPVSLGSNIATIDVGASGGGGVRFRTSVAGNSAYLLANTSGVDLFTGDNLFMRFGTNGTERVRITSGGEFVIGGTSASSGFALTLDKSTGGGLVLKHNGTDKAYFFLSSSTVSRWETVTGATIQVSSGNSNGVSLANGATSWAAISDVRLKTDLVPIQDAVNKVSSIRAVTGRFNTDDVGTSRAFLIAQDVQAVLPEAVDVADDEIKTLGLRYTDTIPLLVAAIKEQQALITALTARVAALEAQP